MSGFRDLSLLSYVVVLVDLDVLVVMAVMMVVVVKSDGMIKQM